MTAMTKAGSAKLSLRELAEQLEREPLVGVTAAAKLLGIKPPNFKRDAAPHLIRVPVEGSADVYFRSEVQQLAKDRAGARAAKSTNGGPSGANAVHQPGPNVENVRSSSQSKRGVQPVPKRG